jgi:hypothetical protein
MTRPWESPRLVHDLLSVRNSGEDEEVCSRAPRREGPPRARSDERSTGRTESELLRSGLHLVATEEDRRHSALDLAGRSAERFKNGPLDLSTSWEHLEGFGR